jgi:hypothetical protein
MHKIIIPLAVLTLATAAHAKADRDAVPPAASTGKPVSCIRINEVQETRVHGDKVIDFMTSNTKGYRNVLPYECPSLGFEERFLHKTSTNDYCAVDTITVLQSPGLMHGATCGLGEFQPIELIKETKK